MDLCLSVCVCVCACVWPLYLSVYGRSVKGVKSESVKSESVPCDLEFSFFLALLRVFEVLLDFELGFCFVQWLAYVSLGD